MIRINLLPKNLRKRVEPGWWRLIAVALPVLTLGVVAAMHISASQELSKINGEIDNLNAELNTRQAAVLERKNLLAKQAELQVIVGVDQQLRTANSPWTPDLKRFVEQIPSDSGKSSISLASLNMRSLTVIGGTPPAPNPAYAGKNITKEFTLAGKTLSSFSLVNFIRAFEENDNFGIQFQSAQRDAKTGEYTFSVVVGLTALPVPAPAGTTGTTPPADGTVAPAADGTTPSGAAPADAAPAPAAGGTQ